MCGDSIHGGRHLARPGARMGVRMLLAAGFVGLLVLLLGGPVHAGDDPVIDPALVDELARSDSASPSECVERAQRVLRTERNARLMDLNGEILDAAWSAASSSSPTRALGGVRDVGAKLWSFRGRSVGEDLALEWLDIAARAEPADLVAREMRARLRRREIDVTVATLLDAAESSLESDPTIHGGGRLLAGVRIARALELSPRSDRALELRDLWLTPPAVGAGAAASGLGAQVAPIVTASDVDLSTALLLGDFGAVAGLSATTDSERLARSVARYLSGRHDEALADLGELAGSDTVAGTLAADWIAREDINVERALSRAVRGYRLRQGLGLLGGSELAKRGWDLSAHGYRAWQRSINPLNVAIAMPLRLMRGFRPSGDDVREAAKRYLDARPQGERTDEARAWLDTVGRGAGMADAAGLVGLDLPQPPVRFRRLTPRPLLLTRAALDSVYLSELAPLRIALGEGTAVVLHAEEPSADDIGASIPIDRADASRLLSELEIAIEQVRLVPVERGSNDALVALYQLQAEVRGGARLVAIPGTSELGEPEAAWLRMQRALTDGGTEVSGAVVMEHDGDEIHLSRFVGRGAVSCPSDMLCIDHESRWSGRLYAKVDSDSSTRVGFKTRVRGAQLSLSLSDGGPAAQVVLPVGRWLGLGGWLPLSAKVRVSADSIYVGPHISDED